MVLYGSLGGFLLGVANTSSIFALLLGMLISKYYPAGKTDMKNI